MSGAAGEAPELATATAAFLHEVFGRLEGEVALESQAKGTTSMDPAYAVRFAFALVFGVAVLDQALFPRSVEPGRTPIAQEMSGFILRGASIPES
jgi:hypothetical protein